MIQIPPYEWIQSITTVIVAVFASGGFWAYLQSKTDKHNASTKLILGLAHNEIIVQGLAFIERGYITKDEYEDYVKYLYTPYSTFGGNGLAERVFKDVGSLPIRRSASHEDEIRFRRDQTRKEDYHDMDE